MSASSTVPFPALAQPGSAVGDTSFHSVAPALRSHCILAAVRSATVGMPIEVSATPPFTDGHWLLAHNGVVDRAVLPAGPAAESVCDSAILAATIFAHGLDALGDTIVKVGAADPNARLNILAANGSRLIATTWETRCPSCGAPTGGAGQRTIRRRLRLGRRAGPPPGGGNPKGVTLTALDRAKGPR